MGISNHERRIHDIVFFQKEYETVKRCSFCSESASHIRLLLGESGYEFFYENVISCNNHKNKHHIPIEDFASNTPGVVSDILDCLFLLQELGMPETLKLSAVIGTDAKCSEVSNRRNSQGSQFEIWGEFQTP